MNRVLDLLTLVAAISLLAVGLVAVKHFASTQTHEEPLASWAKLECSQGNSDACQLEMNISLHTTGE